MNTHDRRGPAADDACPLLASADSAPRAPPRRYGRPVGDVPRGIVDILKRVDGAGLLVWREMNRDLAAIEPFEEARHGQQTFVVRGVQRFVNELSKQPLPIRQLVSIGIADTENVIGLVIEKVGEVARRAAAFRAGHGQHLRLWLRLAVAPADVR